MNYGIKLNFSSKLWTVNVNVLDNKVGTWRLRRSLPLMWCYSQSEADKEEERIKTIFLACVSPLEKKWKKDRMKVRCSDHQRLDFFHPICIFLAVLYFNLAFNIHFQGKLLNLLAKASSAQHHLSQYLMLHLILKHYTSLQYS